jgi:p-hydroxybenzoate 3-monooxygenase
VRTQVGIIGAGPAGLLLSHLLALRGIDSVVVEIRSRAYCEARQRAGVLESGSVQVLREAGLAARLDRHGLEHGGIYLQFGGQRRHLDFRDLTGRTVTVYAQTEIVKDLIAARIAAGGAIEFEVSDTEVDALDTDRPVLRYTRADGTRHEVACDAIAGCDGFHGICRDACRRCGKPATRTPGSASWPACRRPPTSSSTAITRRASPCTACGARS